MTRSFVATVLWVALAASAATQVTAALASTAGQPKRYTGAPADFDFQGADLRMVLRSFAELGGLNLVIDPGVTGTIDIKLTRVPLSVFSRLLLGL